ncbi:hypothetical protein SORBI_3008G065100 [Sorghum bicolor]|uniref:Acidic protein n=1 Tax=Sorghum bicolor TaxID=4558 RepID=A0A1B6PBT5_SORBI|nr:hypothetical protein SORBI_3008G065100 [Sorghum bicolor]
MALRASALKGGDAVAAAAICVALIVCWVGKPAAQGSPTCGVHRCISECPSKCNSTALSSCEGVKSTYVGKCWPNCIAGCTDSCHSAGVTACDDVCNSQCDSNCNSSAATNPYYLGIPSLQGLL